MKPNARVIMLTGPGYGKEKIERALVFGAAGYVGKAMPVKTIVTKIKAVLRK